jgi:cellobiose phosphorylase
MGVCRRLTAAVSANYRYRETYYHIAVRRTETEMDEEFGVTVDGVAQEGQFVPVADDHKEHRVEVRVANRRPVP